MANTTTTDTFVIKRHLPTVDALFILALGIVLIGVGVAFTVR